MGASTVQRSGFWAQRCAQEERALASQMVEHYGRDGEKLRSQLAPPDPAVLHQASMRRTLVSLPEGHDPSDIHVRPGWDKAQLASMWDKTLVAAQGLDRGGQAHRTFGGFNEFMRRPMTGAGAAGPSRPPSSKCWGENDAAWEASSSKRSSRSCSAARITRSGASGLTRSQPDLRSAGGEVLETRVPTSTTRLPTSTSFRSSKRTSLSAASTAVLRREVERAVQEALAG